jgi:cytochrome c oxidase subunit 2
MRLEGVGNRVRRAFPAVLLFLVACARDAPQDALKPEGPVARTQHSLFIPVFWVAAAIFFRVEGLIVFAAIRFRDRGGREEPKQIHGNTRLEFAWTLVPALIMLGVAIPTVLTIFRQAERAEPGQLDVTVIGHQWWWEYRYVDAEVATANELVVPINRPVYLALESADVIHSFWVPRLGGKQDVVPERVNTLRLIAEKPGEYFGQCAEFCSISHANMRLKLIAKTEADFATWLRDQQRDAVEPTTPDARRGKELFFANACVQCHAIAGTSASGTAGPDLTHFASRGTFGAATFPSTDQELFLWVKQARERKPGVVMPNFDRPVPKDDPGNVPGFRILTDEQIRMIVAYLRSLT